LKIENRAVKKIRSLTRDTDESVRTVTTTAGFLGAIISVIARRKAHLYMICPALRIVAKSELRYQSGTEWNNATTACIEVPRLPECLLRLVYLDCPGR